MNIWYDFRTYQIGHLDNKKSLTTKKRVRNESNITVSVEIMGVGAQNDLG